MKLAIDTDAVWHRIRRAFWRWTTKGYGPGFTVPGRCADCGIPLTYYECTYYGKTCERCEGIAFHAQQAAEPPICADTGAPKWPGDCWNVRCQLGKTCCRTAGVMASDPLDRAKQIRDRVDALDAEREALWQEYLRILPAGKIDAEDMAWATGKDGVAPSDAPQEFFCNKCGYFGPVEVFHERPNGSGKCDYMAVPMKASESRCKVPPPGWSCSREPGHEGPCAARPVGVRVVDLRQQFEAWTKRQPGDEMALDGSQWGVSFLYSDPLTQAAWIGYQGAARTLGVMASDESKGGADER